MSELNVKRLIEQAENLINDDQLGFANAVSLPVQKIEIEGIEFELRVLLTRDRNQDQKIINQN